MKASRTFTSAYWIWRVASIGWAASAGLAFYIHNAFAVGACLGAAMASHLICHMVRTMAATEARLEEIKAVLERMARWERPD